MPRTPRQETLDRIPRGETVRIVGIDGEDAIARRLDDLGLREGSLIRVLRRAPLGDPTVFEVHDYQLCLRRSESNRVRVEAAKPSGGRAEAPA